jgi:CDP-diacylglycerol--glycerol-3-phosphate 3-phosphatidyltransferase
VSLYRLKPRFQGLLRPLVLHLSRIGVSANQVTVAACVISVALGALLCLKGSAHEWFLLVPVWLLLRMGLNAIDGMLAREFGQASPLGAYLNELADVVSDAALYLPFALLPGSSGWAVGGIIVLAIVSEMAGVLGIMVGASRRYDGPMGKSDRAFVFGLIALLAGCGVPLEHALGWIWAALALLTLATIVNRVRCGIAERVGLQNGKMHARR